MWPILPPHRLAVKRQILCRSRLSTSSGSLPSPRRKNDYYQVLGLPTTATQTEIRDAFYALSKKYHPDVASKSGEVAELRFHEIREAYDALRDEESRGTYDKSILRRISVALSLRKWRTENASEKNGNSSSVDRIARPSTASRLNISSPIKREMGEFRNPTAEVTGRMWEDRLFRWIAVGFFTFCLSYYTIVRFVAKKKFAKQPQIQQ